MHFRAFVRFAAVLVGLSLLAGALVRAQDSFVFRAGPLSLDLPSSWQWKSDRGTIEGRGPNGEVAIVSVRRMKPDAPSEVREQHVNVVRGFAREKMPGIASKNGEVIQPVSETAVSENRVLFTAATKTSRSFGEGYFLQYLLSSSTAMVYLTFEGPGRAHDAIKHFGEIIARHRWAE